MKRWLTHLGISAYLLSLTVGFVTHTFRAGADWHTLMYFVVWDMFSGWSAYEGRTHIIGEGESGKYYELAPGPWGEFHPYGFIDRHHYDTYSTNGLRLAKNVLKHTKHEPMTRLFVIEEEYPKRFNIPDDEYQAYYNKPKEFYRYCHTRFVMTPEGDILTSQPVWLRYQWELSVRDNPRLVADARNHQSFIAEPTDNQSRGVLSCGPFFDPSPLPSAGRPLAQ